MVRAPSREVHEQEERRDDNIALVHLTIALVHLTDDAIDGFALGMLRPAPPVYDPGGLTCIVDDYVVTTPDLWDGPGAEILRQLAAEAAGRGAVQMVVVCGHDDESKRSMLEHEGYPVASEWRVRAIP